MRIYLYCLVALFLGGCETLTTQPLHAAWYLSFYVETSKQSSQETLSGVAQPTAAASAPTSTPAPAPAPVMYVALLNRSHREIEVKDVEINRAGDEGKNAWRLMDFKPRKLASGREGRFVLYPGRLVVFRLAQFKRTIEKQPEKTESFDDINCRIPVEVSIILASDLPLFEKWINLAHGDPFGTIRADLIGRMPSSLPEAWDEKKCRPD